MHQLRTVRSRILLGTCLSLAAALPTAAFASDIVGTVTDATDTRALQSTELRLVELGRVVESGRDGSFRFTDIPAGTYTLEARYSGAEPRTQEVVVPETGSVTANVLLGTDGAILVVGQAANLASSLSRQRAADGVESVLTRDGIGQFPDQNVAESLRRLPGVNILNDQGEGRFVSVRGLDPELNAASINGARVPAPESDVRSVALDVVPSELIESIEVKKSLTPDMDGDTIGASIEINTTSAFDRKKDLFSVKLEGSYNDYADAVTPKGSFDFSTRITDNFGIAGGISYYQRKFETDNIEAADWDEVGGIAFARELQYRDYDVERKRLGGSLSLDWRPSDTTKLYARGLYSRFSDQEYRGDIIFILDEERINPVSGTATSANFLSNQQGVEPTDESPRIEVRRRMKDRFEKQQIGSLVVGGETETGPWKLTYSGSYSKATERENGSVDPTRFRARFAGSGANQVGVNFDYSDPRRPAFTITGNTALFNNPASYGFNELELTDLSDSKDREWGVRGDVAREFAMDAGTFTLQGGVKSRWRKKSYDLDALVYDGYDGTYTLADVLGSGYNYRIQDLGPLPGKTSPSDFYNNNTDSFELNDADTIINSASSDYSIKEDVLAGYVLGRFDGSAVRVVGGVRFERTYNDIRAFATNEDTLDVTPNRSTRSYTDWLPSLTLRFEPAQNLVLRLAGYKNLVRPKLSNLAPRVLVNEDLDAEFGNPNLKPYRAWNIDASAEYYFGNNSAITAGVFWKSIDDFIVEVTDNTPGEILGIDYERATTFTNGETAKVKGIELSFAQRFTFLPSPLDGLLLNANYTFTDAKGTVFAGDDLTDPRRINLPASSKHTFNVVLGYEKGPISLRAAGTYRDKYLDELGGGADEDRYIDQHFQLDLSAKFRVTNNVRLFAEWVNVTDAPYFAYQNFEGAKRILQYEKYSWTAKFGVSANF
ncbi:MULTISPECIES: TonB-dependent receptor [unclassified Sphingopyxis]|jgi:TonB-dependent receptor|uniref:TonB-dependent receptor n=1 Tax=unclassified Sphingopyxis TaxID=2614943 RepID=UPI0006C5816F|nr:MULTISPECIES: TonB-dependent receptor [unclassified Sphingopyxis]USI76434.1 TonB-dependent receptor [Sphingopyxis sp. USTB-05]GAO76835.1 N-acetylglucosamine-regulated TonB-dependent outer membrane receptor [Sphingopyxis sp. C-1]